MNICRWRWRGVSRLLTTAVELDGIGAGAVADVNIAGHNAAPARDARSRTLSSPRRLDAGQAGQVDGPA